MFTNCFLGTLIGLLSMLLNGCLIIEFKEKSKFMLKIWQKFTYKVFLIKALFKLIMLLSIQDQMYENLEHQFEVYIFMSTTALDLYFRDNGFKHLNAALEHIVEETDEEQTPLFEHKDNITNNGSPVHVLDTATFE